MYCRLWRSDQDYKKCPLNHGCLLIGGAPLYIATKQITHAYKIISMTTTYILLMFNKLRIVHVSRTCCMLCLALGHRGYSWKLHKCLGVVLIKPG